jgi:1-acyl-sn-glycerol-3-phosphate acyltransferase
VGPELPEGPVVIVTNHPNMLMDPLLALNAAGRRVRVLAKAPLFEIPFFGQVLRSVDTLPLYRVQDRPDQLQRNVSAFREAVETLSQGGAILTFPEGKSHASPALAPLKTGAARMALEAEDAADWRLGIRVVPLGLAYQRKHRFRSRVVAGIGQPIVVLGWRGQYEVDRAAAARSLTSAITSGLERQTLNLSEESDRERVETADLVYARAKGLVGWRQREPLAERLPRLQRFARQFAWLRAEDPDRWDRLNRTLSVYGRWLRELGSGEADVPPRYRTASVVRFVLREAAVLAFGLPAAALGTLAWYVPFFFAGIICRLMRPDMETVATVKLLAGLILYPATLVAWVVLAAVMGGPAAAVLVTVLLPLLGYVALQWQARREEVWEDVKLFLRVLRHPKIRDQLSEERAALAAELEAIELEWERTGMSPTGVS